MENDELFENWDDAMLEEAVALADNAPKLTSNSYSSFSFSDDQRFVPPKPYFHSLPSTSYHPPPPLPPATFSSVYSAPCYSPPRELSQRNTAVIVGPPPNPPSDKDLEIERLKRELEHATQQIENLEKERVKFKKERDKKEDKPKFTSSGNEGESACANCSKAKSINKDFGTVDPNCHNTSKFKNGVSLHVPIAETTFKAKGVQTDIEAQGASSDDLSAYLDLSQKLRAIWGSPTKRMGHNVISKLLANLSSSGVALHHLKDRYLTPEAAKISNFYLALTKIADGTDILETLIGPLLDLCGMENCTLLRDNVIIEGLCDGKDLVDFGVKDENLVDEEIESRKECQNHQNSLQPHVNWVSLFEIMHQIAMRITEERVRVEAVSIMKLLFLRSNGYFEREQFSQKIVFKTISELLKKDAGLCVKKHTLRLLYLVLNCPKLLAAFCCGCKEGDASSAMNENESTSDFQYFKIILQGLSDCVAPHRSGLLGLKVSRNVILVLAFLASSGQPGFEIFVGHKLSNRGVNYLMLILQLLVSEMDLETESYEQQAEIFRERTFLIREILILLNRLVSNPSYSGTVLRGLTSTRDMAGLTIDVASRLSRKGKKNEPDSMVKHIRETEIVDLARLFKKRIFAYLGGSWYSNGEHAARARWSFSPEF
ncbi:uncharacterized protein HKW66_Vig0154070 [Vigna angularis]|uniref:Uncharacterized protein n=1 Tax=Phaseolus angularis TaxID=3914 RepID=A0A8T0JLU8_PHAAN|nr:uncharacterized protein HKW66_Vig0154070 [Vigna angularis]